MNPPPTSEETIYLLGRNVSELCDFPLYSELTTLTYNTKLNVIHQLYPSVPDPLKLI